MLSSSYFLPGNTPVSMLVDGVVPDQSAGQVRIGDFTWQPSQGCYVCTYSMYYCVYCCALTKIPNLCEGPII